MEPLDSTTLHWRRGLLAICAIGFVLWAFNLYQWDAWRGKTGIFSAPSTVPFHDSVVAVTPGSVAAKAGIKTGDTVELRSATAPDRWRFRTGHWSNGETSSYLVLQGATGRRVTFRARHSTVRNLAVLDWFPGALGALIFATIIAWRRPRVIAARILCLVLLGSVIYVCLDTESFITPWPALDFGADAASNVAESLTMFSLVAYTFLFGQPISTTRKAIAGLAFLLIGFDVVYSIVASVGQWSGAFDLWGGPIGMSVFVNAWVPLTIDASLLVAIATAIIAARGRERSLLVWTTAMPFLWYLAGAAEVVTNNIPALTSQEFSETAPIQIPDYVAFGAQFLTPFAIGYALLHRRLLDIGFALNQAAIFTGVSLTIVGLFMLGEWLIGSWLGRMSHATNVTISAVLVLALGFSVRMIHKWVERALDRAFFRKRHDDEVAILDFAEQVAEVTDTVTLVRETKETLERHAGATFVTIAMDDGSGRYGNISDSDPAIVALRDGRKAVDLKTLSTQLQGEFAYPMIARGKLVGALVLGAKRSGDNYAPDESHAIMRLAQEVGKALRFLTLEKVLQDHHLPA